LGRGGKKRAEADTAQGRASAFLSTDVFLSEAVRDKTTPENGRAFQSLMVEQ
jgi:hypothetical protein